jgi:hypothetical protein
MVELEPGVAEYILRLHWQTAQMWGGELKPACGHCAYMDGVRYLWPCPTRRAITGEPEPDSWTAKTRAAFAALDEGDDG